MNYQDWMNVASSSVFLAISVMAALRAKTTPLAPALSQVCAGLFAYQLAVVVDDAAQGVGDLGGRERRRPDEEREQTREREGEREQHSDGGADDPDDATSSGSP